ncbi:MAG: hypothetical protein MN733_36820 [Nitrososphaera sp.]|nr:hypothetical protein [Nitrososphaera sp.]
MKFAFRENTLVVAVKAASTEDTEPLAAGTLGVQGMKASGAKGVIKYPTGASFLPPADLCKETIEKFRAADDEDLFTDKDLSEITGLSQEFFKRILWKRSSGPRWIMVGRAVRYRKRDVAEYLKAMGDR